MWVCETCKTVANKFPITYAYSVKELLHWFADGYFEQKKMSECDWELPKRKHVCLVAKYTWIDWENY